jgi:hypothetical protein
MTAKKIRLIYCYLMCFVSVLILLLNVTRVTNIYVEIIFFKNYYSEPFHLTAGAFSNAKAGMPPEKIEQERQIAIEKHKKDNSKYRKKDMVDSGIYAFYAAIILLIHILIIRRTKED